MESVAPEADEGPLSPSAADRTLRGRLLLPSGKLIIELDGSQHADEKHFLHDTERTTWLQSKGYRVLRFWNADVLRTPEMVMETIGRVLDEEPLPENRVPTGTQFSTLPQGEG